MSSTMLIIFLISLALGAQLNKVDKNLFKSLTDGKTANILITMKRESVGTISTNFKFGSRTEQLNSITNSLQSQSFYSQKNLLDYLNKSKLRSNSNFNVDPMQVESLWISNQVIVRGADKATIRDIIKLKEVEHIQQEKFYQLSPFIEEDLGQRSRNKGRENQTVWALSTIQAPRVWSLGYRGQGIRVGTIDTGVRWTHEALRDNYAGLNGQGYGWFDPQGRSDFPYDDHGHGTHVTGSLCGGRGIGVSPGSKWMTCKGCFGGRCSSFDLASCLQFMLCPTDTFGLNLNCSEAPHVLSNSWGGQAGDKFYSRFIDAFEAAGIIVLFAIGNDGPKCSTVNSPGDLLNVIGVGATEIEGSIAYFSSVGPTLDGLLKPDISAPGHRINSADGWTDDSYTRMSGTSMATPIAAGVVALMLSKNPNLTVSQVRQILYNSSDSTLSTNFNCGGIDENTYPNHRSGHGRVNALKSVQLVPLPVANFN